MQSAFSDDGDSRPPRSATALRDLRDARHARHLGADQADHLALGKSALCLGDEHFGRAIANRPVHEACGAEAASPLASATRLDQEHVAEDGFLGENQRRVVKLIEVAEQAALDGGLAGAAVGHSREAAGSS